MQAPLSLFMFSAYMKLIIFQVNFDLNEKFELEEDSVGSFSCNIDDYIDIRLIDIVERGKPEYIELDFSPFCIAELKNKTILVGSCDDDLLALYDSEFKLKRKITEINNKKIKPGGLACDQNGYVFVANEYDRSLYKLDSELNFIKSIEFDSDWPDITIHRNKIYMCGNKCVGIYSLDLDRITEHYFNDVPVQIRIATDMACIQFRRLTRSKKLTWITRFHKLPSFELVIEHDLVGSILPHNTMFYLYDETGFTLFDKNGNIMKKIEKNIGETEFTNSGMSFFNNALYRCLDGKKICKIVH
jgi:hypothetical protein